MKSNSAMSAVLSCRWKNGEPGPSNVEIVDYHK
jgi:hypothetical protein